MVRFLLENSLGAWWATRHSDSPSIKGFSYLRFLDDGAPAAGMFPGWPARAAEVTVMDPCGGSGHFIVAAFEMLRRMRMEEEGLSEAAAADATIRDNIFMLEIDPRCTQIATFALVFAAWKASGYRPLPVPNIACSGIAVEGQLDDWLKLAGEDSRLSTSLERLYNLFRQAPTLGSLIDPANVPEAERMWSAEYDEVAPLLERALARDRLRYDPVTAVISAAARGLTSAAKLLSRKYTLIATNVPYLARGRQNEVLATFCRLHYPIAKADLATCSLVRCTNLVHPGGTYATVLPQNWLFLVSYRELRRELLQGQMWNLIAKLGEKGFASSAAAGAFACLLIGTASSPVKDHEVAGLDVSGGNSAYGKAQMLQGNSISRSIQLRQIDNPDSVVTFSEVGHGRPLAEIAESAHGITTFDGLRFILVFWEVVNWTDMWLPCQTTVTEIRLYGGRETIIRWENEVGGLAELVEAMKSNGYTSGVWKAGQQIWGRHGVVVSLMRDLPVCLYTGQPFDANVGVIVPRNPDHLGALWAFCSSSVFRDAVRRIDTSLKVTSSTLTKVPFDLHYWLAKAEDAGPLPEPHSDDPTQWLFGGHPAGSTAPLQVAVARLLGYHWPQQNPDRPNSHADTDGIVCLPPVAGEQPAAERLRSLLVASYGDEWSLAVHQKVLADVGFQDKEVADWLCDSFFEQHCRLFHNRSFIWHIWDGRRDGFSALVNYHKLNAANLDKLIYTYLGNWIETQRAHAELGVAGADGRLVAALELKKKLELIRDGEPPYDIYVRWKSLAEQPIGWNPDLNDGVRLNIRPFVTAGALRGKFTINWNKDRGKNPDGSERLNDLHHTRAEKLAARAFSRG
jgi:hypothetical protein